MLCAGATEVRVQLVVTISGCGSAWCGFYHTAGRFNSDSPIHPRDCSYRTEVCSLLRGCRVEPRGLILFRLRCKRYAKLCSTEGGGTPPWRAFHPSGSANC